MKSKWHVDDDAPENDAMRKKRFDFIDGHELNLYNKEAGVEKFSLRYEYGIGYLVQTATNGEWAKSEL